MRTGIRTLLICVLAPAAVAFAQETAAPAPPRAAFVLPKENAVPAWNRYMYTQLSGIVLRSAEKMPEENYSFKPTDSVRSYGQILGHIADAQYTFCSIALGEKNPMPKNEQTKTSKAALTAALKEAFAYCGKAYDGMTDATSAQTVKMFGTDAPRLGVLIVNSTHTTEHYGNLVTYMRMKDVVPPTSEAGFMPPQPPKK
ncbi:MAG: DinB family protein [Acidobacteriota bacterium]|nr:DinB family protein [Acidobacteriota bacterium]